MLELFTHLADWAAYTVMGLEKGTKLADSVHFFIEDTTKIFSLLAVMVYSIGFGRSYVSPEKIKIWLTGKSRFTGYVLAALLGAITPFCSCSSIPLFIAFLSTGMVLGIGGGFVIDALKLEKWVEPYVWDIKMPTPTTETEAADWRWREKYARGEATDIIKRVWIYVFIGVGLGASLHGYVPREWLLEHVGPGNPFAVPLAVLVGIPLYANAVGIVPVAEVLLDKGVSVGTILAFIMSVVAISLPEIIILRKVLKPQMLMFFVGFLFAAFIGVGYLFNFIFGG